MQQDDRFFSPGVPTGEAIAVVYMAASWIEAMVIRGLLESAGIESPALGDGNMPELASLSNGIEIYTLESQADRARTLIQEHLDGADDLDEVSRDPLDNALDNDREDEY